MRSPTASPQVRLQGYSVIQYKQGGENKIMKSHGGDVVIPADANSFIYIASDTPDFKCLQASYISASGNQVVSLYVSTPIRIIEFAGAPNLQVITKDNALPYLQEIYGHINNYNLHLDVIGLINVATSLGTKTLRIGADDIYYAATKTYAESHGWTVVNI